MTYTIIFTEQPSTQEIEAIHKGLEKHAQEVIGATVEHVYDGYDNDSKFYFFRKKI